MFAIAAPRSDTAAVFDAVPVTEHPYEYHNNAAHRPGNPTYLITPHRFCQRDNMPSFTIPDRPANRYIPAVTLMAATPPESTREHDRRVIFHGDCRPSEASVYTIYHPAPIPIYVFEGSISWPTIQDNVLRIFPGDRVAYRFWLRRWDPDVVFEEYTSVRNRYATAVAALSARHTPVPDPPRPPTTALPKFVADALITSAISAAATCPITMEPITADTAKVTPCYHIFDKTALAAWIASGNVTCPTCKHQLPSVND